MKVSHIGIAVRSLEDAVTKYSALFGNDDPHRERVEEQGVDVASYPVGDAVVELTAATREDSPIARFIEKRGEGIHHLAFEVEDLPAELARLEASGVRLIAFVHPSSFNGVLVELCQKKG